MGVFKKGKDWWIDYYVSGRRKREKIGPNRRLADTVLQKRKVEIAEGKFLDKRKEVKVRFSDFAKDYLAWSKVNKRSNRRDKISLNRLLPVFGEQYLFEITPEQIERYKAKRSEVVKHSTINRELACIKHMFTKAIEWGRAYHNPVKSVKLFKENNARLRYLEPEEIESLLEASPPHLKPIVACAVNTGMRKHEVLGLKWEQVDLKNRIIFIEETKNGERREIPINDTLLEVFQSLPRQLHSPYVFCKRDGQPYGNVRKGLMNALRRAGLTGQDDMPLRLKDFTFHDLRHTFASNLVMAGVPVNTVKELLGHKTLAMTLRYSLLSPDHKRSAVASLDTWMDTNMDTGGFQAIAQVVNPLITKGIQQSGFRGVED